MNTSIYSFIPNVNELFSPQYYEVNIDEIIQEEIVILYDGKRYPLNLDTFYTFAHLPKGSAWQMFRKIRRFDTIAHFPKGAQRWK